jgi:UDP-N-acetylglucosamine--N-acetylmuramyl-(pentapeptide) pyrophosphoryl-undecaprenol N-acetylglucosamine transferase
MESLPKDKVFLTGNPIRPEMLEGDAGTGRKFCGFTDFKPVILLMGGSLGSELLNNTLKAALAALLNDFNVVHLCGRGKLDEGMKQQGYAAFEYLDAELRHVLAVADLIVSRAGANSLNEFLALRKPALLIPLGKVSRGDQMENAKSFVSQGFSLLLEEANLTPETLIDNIKKLHDCRKDLTVNMKKSPVGNAAERVVEVILNVIK